VQWPAISFFCGRHAFLTSFDKKLLLGTVQVGRHKIFQDLILGDLGFKKKTKSDGLELRTPEEGGDAREHFFLQQLGDSHSNPGAIGKIGKKATKA
jgi:hypothetical protein